MIRVRIPHHLRVLAQAGPELELVLEGPATIDAVLDALEIRFPMLQGTVRDHATHQRRPYLRFIANGQDISHEPPETLLPEAVASGEEPLFIIGAIAGGVTQPDWSPV